MANSNKTTIASTLRTIINTCADRLTDEEMAKVKTMLEQTEKKSANRKSKTATEQDAHICEIIASVLSDKPMSATQVFMAHPELSALSTQKVNAMLTKMVDNNEVVRTVDKRKAFFTKPHSTEEA